MSDKNTRGRCLEIETNLSWGSSNHQTVNSSSLHLQPKPFLTKEKQWEDGMKSRKEMV